MKLSNSILKRLWHIFTGKSLVIAYGLTLFMLVPGFGQLIPVPLERPGVAPALKVKQKSTAKKQSDEPIQLPFFDDFSSTVIHNPKDPEAGYPLLSHWEDSYGVWVNDGIGRNPPSVNVATLDGLDSAGRAYDQVANNGFRDALTSRFIDLSLTGVAAAERNSVYLSFFFQWQGNGEAPDASDYFNVDFMTSDSTWVTVMTIKTKSSFSRDVFYDTIVQVSGDQFFHNEFRFRFRTYGRLSGPFDTWNIDYVYLNKGRNANDLTFLDRAIASNLSPIFGEYRSVPIKHFFEAPLYTAPKVDIQNLRGGPDGAPTDYNILYTFTNYVKDVPPIVLTKPFGPLGSKYPDNNLQPGERFTSTLRGSTDAIVLSDPDIDTYLMPSADSIHIKVKVDIYEPDNLFFAANDTISARYRIEDYYAYDDGTAENAAVLSESDDQVAQRFDMITSEPHELVGFDVYIPNYTLSGGFTTVTFFVMDALNGEPNERKATITHVVRSSKRDGFQSVSIEPIIVRDQFFIGWKGSATNPIRVGLDYSNNTTAKIYEDLNGVLEDGKIKWFPVSRLTEGTLMIRPNFGVRRGIDTNVTPERVTLKIYPNPSGGQFTIEGVFEQVEIISVSGQRIPYTISEGFEHQYQLQLDATPGLYLMRIKNGNQFHTERVIIR